MNFNIKNRKTSIEANPAQIIGLLKTFNTLGHDLLMIGSEFYKVEETEQLLHLENFVMFHSVTVNTMKISGLMSEQIKETTAHINRNKILTYSLEVVDGKKIKMMLTNGMQLEGIRNFSFNAPASKEPEPTIKTTKTKKTNDNI